MSKRAWAIALSAALVVALSSSIFLREPPSTGRITYGRWPSLETLAEEHARVTFGGAGAPFGKLTLVRRGKDHCAIRFTSYAAPWPTWDGKERWEASYDWYQLAEAGASGPMKVVKSGHSRVVVKMPVMWGHIPVIALTFGTPNVVCGPFELRWFYPVSIAFYENPNKPDLDLELAPSRWHRVEDVDLRSPSLTWYRYHEGRSELFIHLDKL